MTIDWKKEIATLVHVKQVISGLDKDHIWQNHLPEVAASEEEIAKAGQDSGITLDHKYADFLRHANGWRCFYQSIDLFGTRDLLNSDAAQHAKVMLSSLDDAVRASGLNKEELLPIGSSVVDVDVFLLGKPQSHSAGEVYWFAGEEIDRYQDFEEFFLAMVDYNRAEVEDLKTEGNQKGRSE